MSGFITRIEKDNPEPYTVIFETEDESKYRHMSLLDIVRSAARTW